MVDTQLGGGLVFPEDGGTGVADDNEDYNSAGYLSVLSAKAEGEYVDTGLKFRNLDRDNNTVDLTPGHAYLELAYDDVGSPTTDGEYGPPVQQGSNIDYTEQLPDPVHIALILTQEVTLSLDTDAVNDVYLYTPPLENDGVYARHGATVSEPTATSDGYSIYLGTVNTKTGVTSRPNDNKAISGLKELSGSLTDRKSLTSVTGNNLTIDDNGVLNSTPSFQKEWFYADNNGTVVNNGRKIIQARTVPADREIAVRKGELLSADGTARPSGLTLRLIHNEGGSFQDHRVILDGNNDDEFDGEVRYRNETTNPVKAAVIVDNGT